MFNDEITTPCNPCYETSLPQFPTGDSLTIAAGLAATTDHLWFVETVKGTVYQGTATSDGAGRFVIYLKLATDPDGDNVELTLGKGYLTDTYECIHLTFFNSPNFTNTTIE